MRRLNHVRIKSRYRQFRQWEQQPHQVAPLSEETHECATCGTRFEGNYCPRCGQSARIGRYSFKKAFLLFLDVWGIGNRGMFRTIRDLMLRPGYMIRDYLLGMQMAYFPPFKMFFLLFTLSLLVESGLNIQLTNLYEQRQQEEQEAKEVVQKIAHNIVDDDEPPEAKKKDSKFERLHAEVNRLTDVIGEWGDSHISFFTLIMLLFYTLPLWLLIRHCPAMPDLHLSECFVAMVYISNMLSIYMLVPSFLCFGIKASLYYSLLAMPLIAIPVKQLSGYSYWNTIWRMLVALIPFSILALLVVMVEVTVLYIYVFAKFG